MSWQDTAGFSRVPRGDRSAFTLSISITLTPSVSKLDGTWPENVRENKILDTTYSISLTKNFCLGSANTLIEGLRTRVVYPTKLTLPFPNMRMFLKSITEAT